MRAGRVRLLLGVVAAVATACNLIVGVEDVRPRATPADGGDGDGSIDEPGPVDGDRPTERPNVLQVALGEQHTCARKPEGTIRCWGDDDQGQTGTKRGDDAGIVSTPKDVSGIDDAIDIAAGRNHTCVARKSGKVSCWGNNLDGQLGNGESGNSAPTPVAVNGMTNAVAVAAGSNFSCAVRSNGTVACWGGNGRGQLGRGDESPSASPVAVLRLEGVVAIAAGHAHACVVDDQGSVKCWGDGASGQLGAGGTRSSSSPVAVGNLPEAVMVAASERSTCALTQMGSVLCWGANELGQLGTGATNKNANPSPAVVPGLEEATSLWSGKNHTCALRKNGTVVCWGAGADGQLGDGRSRSPDAGGPQPTFVPVSGVQTAIGVGAGGDHSCSPMKTNSIVCWGANARGQLGTGATENELSPVSVKGYP